jgi:hypothetical protein
MAMTFLETVEQREAEKQRLKDDIQNRTPGWAQAVNQLSSLIVQRVQPNARRVIGKSFPVLAQRGTCRVDGFQMATLEIAYKSEEKTATVKPLSLGDPKVQGAVGCVLLEGQGQVCQLLWDGKSQAVPGHWQIKDSDGDTVALTEDTLDETLKILFGLIERPLKPPKKYTRKIKFDDE